MLFDVIVVGGSYAGMAAAMQIARARRRVGIIDAGSRRNRFAETSHGFLSQDGRPPSAIAETSQAQVMAYPSVTWISATATLARTAGPGFHVETADGETHEAKRLVLATGVADCLPDIPGLWERWGRSVFHCPYCHGYELHLGRLGVLAAGPVSMHLAMLVPDWGNTTLFLNEAFDPDEEQTAQLLKRGVLIERERVMEVTGSRADVILRDGRVISLDGLFTSPRTRMASPLAEQLGCVFEEGPMGPFIQTSVTKETSTPGVFACGDAARAAGSVSLAVGDGAVAGVAAHQSLIFR